MTTDADGLVTGLSLASNVLSGSIPSELGDLENLQTLHLSGNSLSGCIPASLYAVATNDLADAGIPSCAEREALVALYNATGGASWTDNSNWLNAGPLGDWYGVVTDADGRVINLELRSNNLRGTIPVELGNLAELAILDLKDNVLTGTIPSELGSLTNLLELVLSNNVLSGAIPTQLGSLANLEALVLDKNALTDTIPSELGNLTNLKYLWLNDNQLSGSIPNSLDALPNLEEVYLKDNVLSGCMPDSLFLVSRNDVASLGLPACAEKAALVALYNATGGANWTNNANWLSDKPLEDWYGVTTYSYGLVSGRVSGLDLGSNLLRGMIPTQLGDLTLLNTLKLHNNVLTGTIPTEFGSLAYLVELRLNENDLSGTIPVELGNLTKLQTLHLSGNVLSGCIPDSLYSVATNDLSSLALPSCAEKEALVALYNATDGANWTNNSNWLSAEPLGDWYGVTTDADGLVTRLSLANNGLSGTIPIELGNLTNLSRLSLYQNSLSGSIPPELGDLANLQVLSLNTNSLSGSIPAELGDLANLQVLSLNTNSLSGTIPPELGDLALLNTLKLHSNVLTGTIPSELGQLSSLVTLYLDGNQLSGPIPAVLGNLTNLNWLNLNTNSLSGSIPAELGNLTNLKWLSLTQNSLSGSIPSELGDLEELADLYLSGNVLSGCIPDSLYNVATNDLGSLALPACAEKEALVALYNATDGANWSDNSNWLSVDAVSTWHGVTTDADGLVTGLSLANNGLSGSIPSELGDLENLQTLHLSGNVLSGCIPASLYAVATNDLADAGIPSCAEREALVALYNATDGANWSDNSNWLSAEPLGDWYGVTTDADGLVTGLSLASNVLSGSIPSELGDLENLQTLYLSGNSLSGCIPDSLYNVATNDLGSLSLARCSEREALVALYNATGGASWTDNSKLAQRRAAGRLVRSCDRRRRSGHQSGT